MISIFNGRERTLGGQTSSVHIQMSVDFRQYLHYLKGASLAVFLSIALHSNEEGWSWPGRELIAHETGYNLNTVSHALARLCQVRIEGHRILLKHQPQAGNGNFKSNHYLIFPSADEIAQFEHHQPALGLPCTVQPYTVQPYTENRYTVKPYTVNVVTKKNHPKEEPSAKEETKQQKEETTTTTPTVATAVLIILDKFGIVEPTRTEITGLLHVTVDYLAAWWDWYWVDESASELRAGYFVQQFRVGNVAPQPRVGLSQLRSGQVERERYKQWSGE